MAQEKFDIFISYRRNGGYEVAKHIKDLLAENGRYPPTQNGDIRSLFLLFILMAVQN